MNRAGDPTPQSQTRFWDRDCRVFLFVIVCTFFGLRLGGALPEFWWDKFPSPDAVPFADLVFITQGGEALAHGEPAVATGAFSYPPPCYWFGYLGLRDSHRIILGWALAVVFFASVLWMSGRIAFVHAPLYLVLLCSPPLVLAVSRGNIDLFVVILMACAVALLGRQSPLPRAFAYALIFYAALLKLYPIAAVVVAVRERRWRGVLIATGLVAAFGLYAWVIRDQLRQMTLLVPHGKYLSFGAAVLVDRATANYAYNKGIGFGLSALVLVCAWLTSWRGRWAGVLAAPESRSLDAFRIGAALFAGCFAVVQYNFIYRFVVVLLTVPQWIAWSRKLGLTASLATTALTLLVLTFWIPRYPWNWTQLDQVCDLALFALNLFALVDSLPAHYRIDRINRPAEI